MNLECLVHSGSMSGIVVFTFEIKERGEKGICQFKLGGEHRNHSREQQPFHADNLPTAGIKLGMQNEQ